MGECQRCGRPRGAGRGSCGLCGPGPSGAPAGAGGAGGGDPGAGAAGGGRLEVLERLARDYAGWTADRPAPGLDRLGTLRDQVGGRPACPLMHPNTWPALPPPPPPPSAPARLDPVAWAEPRPGAASLFETQVNELQESIDARLRGELRAGPRPGSAVGRRPESPHFQARALRSSLAGLGASLDNRQAELEGMSEAQRQSRRMLGQLSAQVRDLQAGTGRPASAAASGGSAGGPGGSGGGKTVGPRGRILEPRSLPPSVRGGGREARPGPRADVPDLEMVAAVARRAAARAVVAAEAQARPGRMLDRLAEGNLAQENPAKLDRLARELVQRFTVPVAPAGGEGAEDACCVCLEPLERDLRMLPCGHRLHGACMRRWLWGKPRCVCPLCKRMAG